MRHLLRDRISAGAIAMLITYLLLLQALMSGLGLGSMAGAVADPFHIICISSGTSATDLGGMDSGPNKQAPTCPHCTLCRLAALDMPAIFDGQDNPLDHARYGAIDAARAQARISAPNLRGLIGQPRAPPISI